MNKFFQILAAAAAAAAVGVAASAHPGPQSGAKSPKPGLVAGKLKQPPAAGKAPGKLGTLQPAPGTLQPGAQLQVAPAQKPVLPPLTPKTGLQAQSLKSGQLQQGLGGLIPEIPGTAFQAEVLNRSNTMPVLIEYWMTGCGWCDLLLAEMEKVARDPEFQGKVYFGKIDGIKNQNLVPYGGSSGGSSGFPQWAIYYRGKVEKKYLGYENAAFLKARLREVLAQAQADQNYQGRNIEGRVTWSDHGQTVSGATVEGGGSRTTTNGMGYYWLKLPPGTYRFMATHRFQVHGDPGCVRTITVPAQGCVRLDFELLRSETSQNPNHPPK